ncbi:MAG: VIT1/CCC1 transporter family protein, partial [Micrococcales bacterium]
MAKKPATSEIKLEDQIIASEEFQKNEMAAKLNWLRAGVLGANDGIASISGLVIGVAGANPANTNALMLSGFAALAAGAFSMAGGEYTSVSAQKDSEIAALAKERKELKENPEAELRELTWFYEQKGLSYKVAREVAEELTKKDALKAHAEAELGINSEQHASPAAAAISSFIAFTVGGALPVAAVLL